MYYLGKFNNVRNNEYDYGFGNFIALSRHLYAFMTFDFEIKIFRILKWWYMILLKNMNFNDENIELSELIKVNQELVENKK